MNAAQQLEPDPEHVNFMIVDDDEISVMAMKRALKKLKVINPVFVAKDGQEALEMLMTESGPTKVLPPFLITLDLNMPRMDGFEFLDAIRDEPALQRAIVFVMTTSDARKDIDQAYSKNVAGYIVKDDLSDSFVRALDLLDSYNKIVVLPN